VSAIPEKEGAYHEIPKACVLQKIECDSTVSTSFPCTLSQSRFVNAIPEKEGIAWVWI
jgi:hypothetical protein